MERRGYNEPHVPVNSPRKGVLARSRRETRTPNVIHTHSNDVVSWLQCSSDIESETGIPAFMLANAMAVYENLRYLKSAIEFQIDALPRPSGRYVEMFTIPTITNVKPVCREIRHGK